RPGGPSDHEHHGGEAPRPGPAIPGETAARILDLAGAGGAAGQPVEPGAAGPDPSDAEAGVAAGAFATAGGGHAARIAAAVVGRRRGTGRDAVAIAAGSRAARAAARPDAGRAGESVAATPCRFARNVFARNGNPRFAELSKIEFVVGVRNVGNPLAQLPDQLGDDLF